MLNNLNNSKETKKAWPTKAAMEQVYDLHLWGGSKHDFYSGEGSHDLAIVNPYVDTLISFLTSFKNPITVCDLGCGDFNVGIQLVPHTQKYIGVDIVPDLIQRNKTIFKHNNLEFECLDIATDILPAGDCVILRQVLQHLSNAEIEKVIPKLYPFKYVILTEHLPNTDFIPNKDIISGQGIRIKKKSGVNLLAAPFQFKVKSTKELMSHHLKQNKGVIVTTLYTV